MDFNRHLHALRGLLQWQYSSSIGNSSFSSSSWAISAVSWEGTLLDPEQFIWGFGWMGVPLFFVLSLDTFLGGQVLDVRLNGAFLKRFWLRRFLHHLSAVWARANHFLLALGTVITGLISGQECITLPFQFFALDQFASVHGATY